MAVKYREGLQGKRNLAKAIEEGLKQVREDHDVFVAMDSDRGFCGCVLAIAVEGMRELEEEEKDRHPDRKHPQFATGGEEPISENLIRRIIKGQVDAIEVFAHHLQISPAFATKLDQLHRQGRVPARRIAEMLRRNEI